MSERHQVEVTSQEREEFKRLDAFLAAKFPKYSRSLIKKFFEKGFFTSKDTKLDLKKIPSSDCVIFFHEPDPEPVDIQPQDIPLDILFEDEHLIVINKPAGLVVHPAAGNRDGTLVNALLFHIKDLKGIGSELRPGIVHRLDKGTSGIMVAAKSQAAHEGLVKLFSSHDIARKYQALALGARIPSEQTLESMIGRSSHNRLKMTTKTSQGKSAMTHLKVVEYFKFVSHIECTLETGRTHQIRVHLSELINAPIINDPLYGREGDAKRLLSNDIKSILKGYEHPLLHAKVLGFKHPITGQEMYFEQEPPEIFQRCLEQFRSESE
ncbi:MAG: RluA family pseudouridine synthase [Halobacteriovoraceae bacterium]|nr:RluA family pseudouridine synthase [Halobacteriovoraceae bacterium]|tara:strand:- start:4757 stop:5725 length:969 start_codon:yes stop_codon:yes gene_type:complete